jgi:hypothetical protein
MFCTYCNNSFINFSSLNKHQKTAKYCLELQNKNSVGFSCEYCSKTFTTKTNMTNHKKTCENIHSYIEELKKENIILKEQNKFLQQKDIQIKELQDQLTSIARTAASRPTHIQNNNQRINAIINNLIPITDEYLKEQAQFLTIDHIKKGASGYAEYALEYPLKDRIFCTDFSRRKINYKDIDGNIVNDPEMSKLSLKLFKSIDEQNTLLTEEYLQELKDKLNTLNNSPNNNMNEEESREFEEQSNAIIDFFFKYSGQRKEIKKVIDGHKSDIINDFVKDVCLKVTI